MSQSSDGQLIFLTGPPGAGKTSTAFVWSMRRPRPTWPLEWDATSSALRMARQLGYSCLPDDTGLRYALAAEVMAEQAAEITAAGNDCIVVGAWARDWPGPNPWAPMEQLQPIVCVLLPNVETAVARNAFDLHRRGPYAVPEEHVRGAFALDWRLWDGERRAVVLDNSGLTIEETADQLELRVQALPQVSR